MLRVLQAVNMSYFHPIKTIEDRERLLKTVLALQTQIRTKRKKDRIADKTQNTKYAKIFEPITRTLKDLHPGTTTSVTPLAVANNNLDVKDEDHPEKEELIEEEEKDQVPGVLYLET